MLKKIILFSMLFAISQVKAKLKQSVVITGAYKLLSEDQKNEQGLKKNPYGVGSVQYLIDTGTLPPLVNGKLDLRRKRLISLEGLQNLPNIKGITIIDLRHNNIKALPLEDYFEGLLSLKVLFLAHNYPPFSGPMKKKIIRNVKVGAPRCRVLF